MNAVVPISVMCVDDHPLFLQGVEKVVAHEKDLQMVASVATGREALIAFRDEKEFEKIREGCYVDVVQDESFYVEANAEELSVAYSIHR